MIFIILYIVSIIFTYGTMLANSVKFENDLNKRYSTETNEKCRRDMNAHMAICVATAMIPIGNMIISFIVTGMYQDGWTLSSELEIEKENNDQ